MERAILRFPPSRVEEASNAGYGGFAPLVRDALRHLHDPIYLQTHPLARLVTGKSDTPLTAGKRLAQLLLAAIGSLQPGSKSGDARTARRYDLLTLRYVEALEIDEVSARLGISRREYNREHRQALDAVVSTLKDSAALSPSSSHATASIGTGRGAPAGHLPLSLTSFVGREGEVQEVLRLLRLARLVTLTGPPGTGKTRLAIRVAEELSASPGRDGTSFPNGVYFVPLSSISDPDLVVSSIAQTLGVHDVPNRSLIETLEDHVSQRHELLLLDNFEHLLGAAPVVSRLLAACPHLSVLATSREPLRLSGEHEFVVPPLQVPEDHGPVSLEQAADCESVRLYVDRAAAMKSGFRLTEQNAPAVTELCRRLDGLPLAIELAAARSKIFPPYALLGRLEAREGNENRGSSLELLSGGARDMPIRQQTLRSAIDWSYRLLAPREQQLFAQLSVFAGGWTPEAAEAVCDVDPTLDILEGIASLVDKSLVRQEEMPDGKPRLSMLETIREYAREQLEASSEEAREARRRHTEYYLACAREGDEHSWGPEHALWLGRLNREVGNLRAALAWSRNHGEIELALQLGGALFHFWHDSGRWSEGRNWTESILELATPAHRTKGRVDALAAAALCNWRLGNFAEARSYGEEGLAICRELGDRRGVGRSLHGLAVVAAEQGDFADARALMEEALSIAQEFGDQQFIALALHNLGNYAAQENDEETARSQIEASRRVWQELGCTECLSLALSSLGDLARSRGRFAEAAAYFRESLDLLGEAGPPGWRVNYLHGLGHALHRQGDRRQARGLFAEALSLSRDLADRRGMAESVASLACLVAKTDPERTARLFGAATLAAEAMGSQLNRANSGDYDHSIATARSQLGDEAFDAAWEQGRFLPLERAIIDALEEHPTPLR